MTMSVSQVAGWTKERGQRLVGATVQELRAPDPERLVLELRRPGVTERLLLCVAPAVGRLHLVSARPRNPKAASAFQGLVRKELRGRLTRIEALPGERIVRLEFATGEGEERVLVAEVFGGGGNLVLLGAGDRVLGRAGRARGAGCRAERGERWTPPPPRSRGTEAEAIGVLAEDAQLEAEYGALELERATAVAAQAAGRAVRAERSRLARLLGRQRADLARAGDAEALRRRAELLAGSFHLLRKGVATIEVVDWSSEGGPLVAVDVDPALPPSAQVERAFVLARKAERADQATRARIEATERALEAAEARIVAVDEGQLPPGRPEEAGEPASLRKAQPRRSAPYRQWWTPWGQEIRAGRSAAGNDALTLHHSKGNDLWLHVRSRAGAHIVVRSPGPSPSPELLLLAAQVALSQSGIADGVAEEVAWTRVKYVRKPKGLAPGKVLVTQERVLYVTADRGALSALTDAPPPSTRASSGGSRGR